MDSTGLLLQFRSDMNDLAVPYLWSDEDVLAYADDAQKMFCRKTDGISDETTPEVVQLAVVPDADRLDLHPSILRIVSAVRTDTGRPVEVINPSDMPKRGWYFDGNTGVLKALVIGSQAHKARLYPKAAETLTVELTVFRLPLLPIIDTDQALEVDEEHHRHLVLWMRHLGYLKADAETFDQGKADDFEARFYRYCENVKAEQRRKDHKTRVVAYGGISITN